MPIGWAFPLHREMWSCRHLPAMGAAMPAGSLHTQAVVCFSQICSSPKLQSLPSCPTSSLLLSCVSRVEEATFIVGDTSYLFYAPLRERVMCLAFSKVLWLLTLCAHCMGVEPSMSLPMSHLLCLTL